MCEHHRNLAVKEVEGLPPAVRQAIPGISGVGREQVTKVISDATPKSEAVVSKPGEQAKAGIAQNVRSWFSGGEKPATKPAPTPVAPKAAAQPASSATEQKPVIEDDGDRLARELRQIAEQNRRGGGRHGRRRRR